MLLPNDEELISIRAEALSEWCRGFLEGLKYAGISVDDDQLKGCSEAIDDFSEIAKLDHEKITSSEDDEEAYMHIVEYVRMVVISVYMELAIKQCSDNITSGLERLH